MVFQPGTSGNPSTQWQPGDAWTGNAAGRPKGKTLSAWLQELLAELEPDGRSRGERLAERLIEVAETGDVKALKLVIDRHDGRVPLPVQLEHAGGLTIKVEYGDPHHHAAKPPPGADGDS